ncbi:hypothetical protein CLOP_g9900 [Closterium sp. NIES-67]|nr:hypothetical protein CLOP_g9900 [Closterium sp. NIES-67]
MVAESSTPTKDLSQSFGSLALNSTPSVHAVRAESEMQGDVGRESGDGSGLPAELLSTVLGMLLSLDDLATAARVNRAWRISALSPSQLRACAIDDDRPTAPSAHSRALALTRAVSRAPMPPKPPPPELWLNPAAFSPFLHFRTPQSPRRPAHTAFSNPVTASSGAANAVEVSSSSLASGVSFGGAAPATPEAAVACRQAEGAEGRGWNSEDERAAGSAYGGTGERGSWSSPRTPSPVAMREGEVTTLEEEVADAVKHGRFLGDLDLRSPRITDRTLQRVLRACPRMQSLRVQHVCMGATFNGSPPPFHSLLSPTSPYHLPASTSPSPSSSPHQLPLTTSASPIPPFPLTSPPPPPYPCGCLPLSARGLAGIGALCPRIKALTLTLQHVVFSCDLAGVMACVGALPRLEMLVVDLHMPFFGQSVKPDAMWSTHSCFTHQAMAALVSAGPAPLAALSLSPCALTPSSFTLLATAFPRLMALDLQELQSKPLHLTHALPLQALQHLQALALGPTLMPAPGGWELPLRGLQRLRLEMDFLPSQELLGQLRCSCPKLKSLHLLWGRVHKGGVMEAYVCPLSLETISSLYSNNQ